MYLKTADCDNIGLHKCFAKFIGNVTEWSIVRGSLSGQGYRATSHRGVVRVNFTIK